MRALLSLVLLVHSCLTLASDDELSTLIGERLGLMKSVAAYKWHNELPIEDQTREMVVVDAAVLNGLNHGLSRFSSEYFYQTQIKAAKEIQQCWHKRWQAGEEVPVSQDLNSTIRPQLLRLGEQITALVAGEKPEEPIFIDKTKTDCLSSRSQRSIFRALLGIKTYNNRYEQIISANMLRVGTTGDYAPFSHTTDGKNFTGIDIDLAQSLAAFFNVELILVQTSWPTLMEDYEAGKFDVAMSGVSITEERSKVAYFSDPYHVGGKTPIALCSRIENFNSVEAIDLPEVTVIVNPGGTNEKFVNANLNQAKKLLHEDNREVFQMIIEGQADLMITDKIEVQLQSALHPELCGLASGETFTYQEKGYLLPRHERLRKDVNNWLHDLKKHGDLVKTFAKHLGN